MKVSLAAVAGTVFLFAASGEASLSDDLVGYWKFDEMNGVKASDSSGFGRDGTLMNMEPETDWVAGKIGPGALDFDGIDDYAETGLAASAFGVQAGHAKAVSVWVCTRAFNDGGIFEFGEPSDGKNFALRTLSSANWWRVQLWGWADLDFYYPSLNAWVHFVMSYDGGHVRIWANGELVGSKQVGLWTGDGKTFKIGRWDWGWSPGQSCFFNGIIDDVRLYARELSEAEVLNLYYAGIGPTSPSIRSVSRTKAGVGLPYTYRVEAAGNPVPSIAVSGLPAWLSFDGVATISGIPSAGDIGTTDPITVTASNGLSPDAVQEFQIVVGESDPSLIGRWKLDEPEGTTASDSVGWNHGTVSGSPQWLPSAGRCGGALQFNGDDEVRISRIIKDDFTIAFWMKTLTLGASSGAWQWWEGSGLVDAEVWGSTGDFGVSLRGDRIAFGVGNPDVTIFSNRAVTDGLWHHVVATRVRSTGAIALYLDGQLEANATAGTHALSAAPEIAFGAIQTGLNRYSGLLDDICIYDRALSADEVKVASGCGLWGVYFDDIDLTGNRLERVDLAVNFDWGYGSPDGAIAPDTFSVRWTGKLEVPLSGEYTFYVTADDGVRLWVAGRLLVDAWKDQPATEYSAKVALTAGAKHSVRLEYYENGGLASVRLEWSGPGISRQIVPACVLTPTPIVPPAILSAYQHENATTVRLLFTEELEKTSAEVPTNYAISGGATVITAALEPDGRTVTLTTTPMAPETVYTVSVSGVKDLEGNAVVPGTAADFGQNGFQGVYYPEQALSGAGLKRIDRLVDFDWGTGCPAPGIGADHFSAMWLAKVEPAYSEVYTFTTKTDDGVRLWVNSELIIDSWRDQPATEHSGQIALVAGQKYGLVMLYYENMGLASAKLTWESASQPREMIPMARSWTYGYVDSTPPGVPADLAAALDDTTVRLSWSPPNDDYGVAGYEVFRNGVKLGVTCSTSWTDTGLKYSSTYAYSVKAFDFAANVSDAAELVVELPAPPLVGTGTGLAASYYDNIDFTGSSLSRVDSTVDFDWGWGSPDPAIGPDTFSVRWEGMVQPQVTETYTFFTQADDGVRLWVAGRLLVDAWYDQAITEHSGKITLLAGQKYPIRLEMYENGGLAAARLLWESASIPKAVIPQTQLYPEIVAPSLRVSSALASPTSPVWVEGDVTANAAGVWVSVNGAEAFQAVRESPTRWYADDPASTGALGIPLSTSSPSAEITITSKDSHGAVIQSVTETITWSATDLAGKNSSSDRIVIRKGDSLLLTATGSGAALEIDSDGDGTADFTGSLGECFAALYASAGDFVASARVDGIPVGSLAVRVVDAKAVPPIGVWRGYERLKTLTVSPAGALGPPSDIVFIPADMARLDVAVRSVAASSATLALNSIETGTSWLQVRIGGPEGPVVLEQEVHAFELTYLTPLIAPVFIAYPDGDSLAGNAIRMQPRYAGHKIHLQIFAGGALFEKTGSTEYVVNTDELSEKGEHLYYVVTPGIICHRMEVADEE